MVAVPAVTPETTPEDDTGATEIVLLVHVPPEGLPPSVIVVPVQSMLAPVIEAAEVTVMERVTYAEPIV